jgi:hypothetical protein
MGGRAGAEQESKVAASARTRHRQLKSFRPEWAQRKQEHDRRDLSGGLQRCVLALFPADLSECSIDLVVGRRALLLGAVVSAGECP